MAHSSPKALPSSPPPSPTSTLADESDVKADVAGSLAWHPAQVGIVLSGRHIDADWRSWNRRQTVVKTDETI